MAATPALMEPSFDVNKLSYEIFSVLESKFLFGYEDPKLFLAASPPETPVKTPARTPTVAEAGGGRVRILSIDGGGRASDGILAGAALARLEASLHKRSGDSAARIADFFDVAAGSGAGGVLAAMLFTRGPDGRPLFSAAEALQLLAKNRAAFAPKKGLLRGIFRKHGGIFRRLFADATLRDTVKPVLIPCYDLATGAPFMFSRADAVESDGYDFRMREVCAATCADPTASGAAAVKMKSVDGRTRIVAVGGGLAMGNPTAAAITHVLNNKQEFPFAAGVEDLLVVSLGSGEVAAARGNAGASAPPRRAELVRIAGEGMADMVDQAVAMAFGHNRTSNYVRIQVHGSHSLRHHTSKSTSTMDVRKLLGAAEEMLVQRNVESVLFQGMKMLVQTNGEKLEWLAGELIKEDERRKNSPLPKVLVKQVMTPRISFATTPIATTTTATSTPQSH
ncbi:patatin-like protein 3 [Elaeis guineensis]|uniref:Patatin n=1 Tax=Elaeis guineensis var. tenera TaxID=51953 RepID=A0A6I9Q8E6_ELAGV|nr:patatin-like protein 3 [Elaeis guineensis]